MENGIRLNMLNKAIYMCVYVFLYVAGSLQGHFDSGFGRLV